MISLVTRKNSYKRTELSQPFGERGRPKDVEKKEEKSLITDVIPQDKG